MRDRYGRFVKGSIPCNKDNTGVYSNKVLQNMRKAKLGKHISPNTEFKKGNKTWNKGMKGLYITGSEKGWFKKGHKWSEEIEEKMLNNLRDKILIRPNLTMNENLAHVIGLLKGDGCIYKNGGNYRICLDSTNKIISSDFFGALKVIKLNPFMYEVIPSNGIGKLKQFRVLANSKVFYDWYNNLTIENLENLLKNKEEIIGFIKGFYEAEGSIIKQKDGAIVISIYNTNLELIELTKLLLEKLGLNFRLNGPYKNNRLGGYNSKPIYRIQTGSRSNVINFLKIVNPPVKTL
jgi:hypothetical protein